MSDTTLVDFEDFQEADDMSFSDFLLTSGGGPGSGRRKGSRNNKPKKKSSSKTKKTPKTPTKKSRGGKKSSSKKKSSKTKKTPTKKTPTKSWGSLTKKQLQSEWFDRWAVDGEGFDPYSATKSELVKEFKGEVFRPAIRGGARNASSSNKDGKKNFELVVNDNVKHVFHNKYARGAALKAATRGYTTIRLRERGTDKVHVFKGSVSREPLAAGASFRAAKDGMVKVPKVKKIRIERL